jgi:hypothetical protein
MRACAVRCSSAIVSELATKYTNIMIDVDALSAVYPLKMALEKLRLSPEHLTPVHAEFAKVRTSRALIISAISDFILMCRDS